jgi:chromosome segregation ATPase
MAMSLSWKIGAGLAGLVVAAVAWNGMSQYLAGRHADEVMHASALAAAEDAQRAKAAAAQHQAQLAADLEQQRQELSETHQQVDEQSRQYQAELAVRMEKQRQEALRVQATYRLDRNQRCDAGIVINHSGSSFSPVVGKTGQPITCKGDTAAEPLR